MPYVSFYRHYVDCVLNFRLSNSSSVDVGFRMADASQGFARFRRTRSVSLSGDAEFVRLSNAASSVLYAGRKSSDYCGTQERWALSRLSLHHDFSRTLSSNCIDRYRGVSRAADDRNSLLRFNLSDTDGVLHVNCLPDDCLEYIFSFLTINERGTAAQVGVLHTYRQTPV